MNAPVIGVALFRLRATLGRRWASYLGVTVLLALLGGISMAAVAGARRTQSAYPAYLAASHSSDLQVQVYQQGQDTAAGPASFTPGADLSTALARLPEVRRVASAPGLLIVPVDSSGRPLPSAVALGQVSAIGSVGGEYFSQDRVAVSEGQMADPARADEIMASAETIRLSGFHLGQRIRLGAYTQAQAQSASFSLSTRPARFLTVTLVGAAVFSNEVVRDDVDQFPSYVLATPALTAKLASSALFPDYALSLVHGAGDVASVEREIINLLPPGSVYSFHVTAVDEGAVGRATRPETLALGVFGAIAGLAALLISGQALSRTAFGWRDDVQVMRALGAAPALLAADVAVGLTAALLLGAVGAATVAIVLSPLTPLGPSRQVAPNPGISVDWTVVGLGVLGLTAVLTGFTLLLALRSAQPGRPGRLPGARRGSGVVGAAARLGLSAPGVVGLRFALERGEGRTSVPVRSALVGSVLAVTVVAATFTFGQSLQSLDSHPYLYGWNWSYAISSPSQSNIPPEVGSMLDRDRLVQAWTGYNFAGAQIDGQTVPIMIGRPGASLQPTILSGHGLAAGGQIVLGAATLAALHKHPGDVVTLSYGTPQDAPVYVPPTRLTVVGVATMPSVGVAGALHPSMGTGALVPADIAPAAMRAALNQADPNQNGPAIVVVKLRPGVSAPAGLRSLQAITRTAQRDMARDPVTLGEEFTVLPVQRPAEIVNYQSSGNTPVILAAGLAGGAVVALGLTLVASVRRRRRDLALLKTLGFTQGQLAGAVAWQASTAAAIGVIIGTPVGIGVGRSLWSVFAREIYALPRPVVPGLALLVVGLAALILANVVAAGPGRLAARTPANLVLRTD